MTVVGEKLVKGVYSRKLQDYAYLRRQNKTDGGLGE